ncbi:hypothetical protein GIB67_038794 [Kingdonia uniflora]|uniref:Uncharacterized protein n=1 Tax=Kingdonia uniflora TaxID=39325 RepID=A0A7J7M0N7_9MAGN|nr:hypothetical protein GIB67_038794 [Kingdonia uniflora]
MDSNRKRNGIITAKIIIPFYRPTKSANSSMKFNSNKFNPSPPSLTTSVGFFVGQDFVVPSSNKVSFVKSNAGHDPSNHVGKSHNGGGNHVGKLNNGGSNHAGKLPNGGGNHVGKLHNGGGNHVGKLNNGGSTHVGKPYNAGGATGEENIDLRATTYISYVKARFKLERVE